MKNILCLRLFQIIFTATRVDCHCRFFTKITLSAWWATSLSCFSQSMVVQICNLKWKKKCLLRNVNQHRQDFFAYFTFKNGKYSQPLGAALLRSWGGGTVKKRELTEGLSFFYCTCAVLCMLRWCDNLHTQSSLSTRTHWLKATFFSLFILEIDGELLLILKLTFFCF